MNQNETIVRIALVQSRAGSDAARNLSRTVARIEEAAAQGARIVCLQELFLGPYFCSREDADFFALAETIPGPTTQVLSTVAARLRVVIIASLFERRANEVYHNTAVVLDADGSLLGRYRKMHIPDDPCFLEKYYFTPGDLGFRAWQTRYGKIGVLICWDQWFPEAARLTALCGAEIIFYPTAIGWLPQEKESLGVSQHHAWETVQCGHAISNGCYIAAANRTGREESIEFWGQSFVSDPFGQVIARAPVDHEAILTADCDLARSRYFRRDWPFFRDRRIDAYSNLQQRLLDQP